MYKRYFPTLLIIFLLPMMLLGQREKEPVGHWQYHLPLRLSIAVTESDEMVYCAANAGLYYYDKATSSAGQYTKQDGLTDIQINDINYHRELGVLVVAYEDANIDLISGDQIINIGDIFRKQIVGEKRINKITFRGKQAYLACSFGVVVLDLEKYEISESYQSLDTDGSSLDVSDITFSDSLIYLATEKGILYSNIVGNLNLLDFNNWNRYTATEDSLPDLSCTRIEYFDQRVFGYFADTTDSNTYVLQDDVWNLDPRFDGQIEDFSMGDGELIATTKNRLITLSEGNTVQYIDGEFGFLKQAVSSEKGNYWMADLFRGLTYLSGSSLEVYTPDSPSNARIFSLATIGDHIYALRGGYDGSYTQLNEPMNVDVLDEYRWSVKNYSFDPSSEVSEVKDVLDVVINPSNSKLYYASHGYGILEEYEPDKFNIYNDQNSPLVNALDSGNFVRITGLDMDNEGTLWAINHTVPPSQPSLHSYNEADGWNSFTFSQVDGAGYPEELLVDEFGQKWMLLSFKFGGGILLVSQDNEDYRLLTTTFEQGMLPTNQVLSIAEGTDGEIWVGTSDGVAVFDYANLMFEDNVDNDARTPIFEGRPLLEGESVTTIAVDAGDRKWIGTPRGVWLFSKDGLEVIHNFTVENSPLPSNNIIDITIHSKTGEVFIATDEGLVSYRSDASQGSRECQNVEVFPNPVRPGYNGQIAINGLSNNAGIKIVDIAGNLVYETEANGGMAVWNGKDYNGQRVAGGIYQIIAYGGSRQRSCITRVAIVN